MSAFTDELSCSRDFLLCNPQNPTGKVFTAEELKTIVGLCQKQNSA
ncbi:aminotransferase class I/II-fold pyridoxal phosphate-dependent enzyme [Rhizobium nepotum]